MVFKLIPGGMQALKTQGMLDWMVKVTETGATNARRLVNKDTGDLAASISARIDTDSEGLIGWVFATKNYAAFQEFEPGEDMPGIGTRHRAGGKPYLRPGVHAAIAKHTR